ncbi:hypothetical protein JHK86_024971 [Glycine max]|nr:hypothetical protein JHK86_024971 [Glycine max]
MLIDSRQTYNSPLPCPNSSFPKEHIRKGIKETLSLQILTKVNSSTMRQMLFVLYMLLFFGWLQNISLENISININISKVHEFQI